MSDREALASDFSARAFHRREVTNVSGRGVGMDVVKTNIEKIGGMVDLASRPGEGTTREDQNSADAGHHSRPGRDDSGRRSASHVIPQVSLLELVRLRAKCRNAQIERIHGTPVYRRRGNLLPLVYLAEC